ncbi:MAG TPA: sulfate adenylyltransferase subunit CysD [Saprospiraceae bacterium]|nr:sulfate adenylyltransferase subunit CysD [Saprospiraceae bacterium]
MNALLKNLEDESIYILREVAGQFERPALLFSGGKDSIVLVHLSLKAFTPCPIPFPLIHIDTGHNFPETLDFRDQLVARHGLQLIVRYVQNSIDQGKALEEIGKSASRNGIQTVTLLDTIEEFRLDACIGGARRDEEKSRAKERIFSIRDIFGQWNEKKQRPEVFDLYNGKIRNGENIRVFPISNWTELDIWNYIKEENIDIPPIYFAHPRPVLERENLLIPVSDYLIVTPEDKIKEEWVRFRTVGDMTCTAATASRASSLDDIINEITVSGYSERGTRIDDKRSDSAMEVRKKAGYF